MNISLFQTKVDVQETGLDKSVKISLHFFFYSIDNPLQFNYLRIFLYFIQK